MKPNRQQIPCFVVAPADRAQQRFADKSINLIRHSKNNLPRDTIVVASEEKNGVDLYKITDGFQRLKLRVAECACNDGDFYERERKYK